ncbi:hypothetical protein KJY77_02385 [Canibacter sp. lx-72]|nr:hypothetical protein [Canibacter zhuwentaonis]MBT1017991.1 hypothetical protein [Canibacter zhuwentaonis]
MRTRVPDWDTREPSLMVPVVGVRGLLGLLGRAAVQGARNSLIGALRYD